MASEAAGAARDIDAHVIRLAGELDIAALDDLQGQLTAAAEVEPPTVVVVDLSQVAFIDCAALRPILHARERLDGRLRLCSPSQPVLRLLRVLDLTSLAT